jgi:hypothetical protein
VIIKRPSVAQITFQGMEFLAPPTGPSVLDEFLDRWHGELIQSRLDFGEMCEREYEIVDGKFAAAD